VYSARPARAFFLDCGDGGLHLWVRRPAARADLHRVRPRVGHDLDPFGDLDGAVYAKGSGVSHVTVSNGGLVHSDGTADDGAFNSKATIGTITVNGDVIFASIAAGIMPGGNKMFGDGDDQRNTWPGVPGTIRTITVKGLVWPCHSADHYGIVAHGTIGAITVVGFKVSLPSTNGNPIIAQNWR